MHISSLSVRRKEVSLSATVDTYSYTLCTLSSLDFFFCCCRVGSLLIQDMGLNKLRVAVSSNHLLSLGLWLYQ